MCITYHEEESILMLRESWHWRKLDNINFQFSHHLVYQVFFRFCSIIPGESSSIKAKSNKYQPIVTKPIHLDNHLALQPTGKF